MKNPPETKVTREMYKRLKNLEKKLKKVTELAEKIIDVVSKE